MHGEHDNIELHEDSNRTISLAEVKKGHLTQVQDVFMNNRILCLKLSS